MNNSTADLLTITEATVDVDGAFTASSVASDAAVSGTDITGSGTVQGTDLIATNMATGATVTLASYTATGQLDSTETSVIGAITVADLSVNDMVINTTITVDGTINFAADAQGDDDYEISLSGVTALTTGMMVIFTATTANTEGATLEITEVGDLDAILKMHDTALATGDIEAGQVVVCVFDGTNWQMTSQIAQ